MYIDQTTFQSLPSASKKTIRKQSQILDILDHFEIPGCQKVQEINNEGVRCRSEKIEIIVNNNKQCNMQ